jgi:hypothetical protein
VTGRQIRFIAGTSTNPKLEPQFGFRLLLATTRNAIASSVDEQVLVGERNLTDL